jgi:tRNA (cytidine56-2'-O)-methyltransferase
MYGLDVDEISEKIKEDGENRNVLVIVGGSKVPGEVYQLSNYNVAVGNQPHSEVSAIAILLDRISKRKEFEDGKIKIIPCEKGKKFI